jgi:hypothetical protein
MQALMFRAHPGGRKLRGDQLRRTGEALSITGQNTDSLAALSSCVSSPSTRLLGALTVSTYS